MGLTLTHKIHQGVRVEGNGKNLDLLVKHFGGEEYQSARLEITEGSKSRELSLKCEDGYVSVTDYLEIRIVPRNPHYMQNVKIDYNASRDYLILRNELLERGKIGDK